MAAVNEATGRDYQWFFDAYLYSAALPELIATRDARGLSLHWRTQGDKPFPMPVEVRVDGRVHTLDMADGSGRIELPVHATYTLDPGSKVLRELPHIVDYQQQLSAQAKAEAEKKAAGGK